MTDLSKLRDQMLEQRALQQQAKVASEKATAQLKENIKKFNDEHLEKLMQLGIDCSFINNINFTYIQEDAKYLSEVKAKFEEAASSIQQKLEEKLGVQS